MRKAERRESSANSRLHRREYVAAAWLCMRLINLDFWSSLPPALVSHRSLHSAGIPSASALPSVIGIPQHSHTCSPSSSGHTSDPRIGIVNRAVPFTSSPNNGRAVDLRSTSGMID